MIFCLYKNGVLLGLFSSHENIKLYLTNKKEKRQYTYNIMQLNHLLIKEGIPNDK